MTAGLSGEGYGDILVPDSDAELGVEAEERMLKVPMHAMVGWQTQHSVLVPGRHRTRVTVHDQCCQLRRPALHR